MVKQAAKQSTRERLIRTALQQIDTHGINGLTLDVVAQEAGVSKGGLLHHFRSKDALIEAMLRQLFADFDARVQQYVEQEPPGAGRWLRGYIRATFHDDPPSFELVALLLGAVTANAALMDLIRDDWQHWQQRLLHDGVPAPRAMVIRQAADAYWQERLMGVAPTDDATRRALINELLQLTEVE